MKISIFKKYSNPFKKKTPEVPQMPLIQLIFKDLLYLYFNIHSTGKLKLHQRINSLGTAAVNVNQPLVSAKLKLLT